MKNTSSAPSPNQAGDSVFIERVALKNYKSIKECDVKLGPLTFLIGPNGAGKSNFIDAIGFVADSLKHTLEHALRDRGGITGVKRISIGHPTYFGIRLDWKLPNSSGKYSFLISTSKKTGFSVQREECHIEHSEPFFGSTATFYRIEDGKLIDHSSDLKVLPIAVDDRLYLMSASGLPEFRPIYNALSNMGFYNLNPDEIREFQPPDVGEILKRDGANLASVLDTLHRENKDAHDQIIEFLSKVVPGITAVSVKRMGKKEILEFSQSVGKKVNPWKFLAENMSDGTLRALGILTALFQTSKSTKVPFIGIEEPEVALHPGAAGVLRDSLRAASRSTQIAVTSHSPDLLDDKDISDSQILAVSNNNGETAIGPMGQADRESVRKRLYTVGELMRISPIEPDMSEHETIKQLDLFTDIKP
ncbi:MAG: AAA family ATPase [Elusimicrobiales bacterium]